MNGTKLVSSSTTATNSVEGSTSKRSELTTIAGPDSSTCWSCACASRASDAAPVTSAPVAEVLAAVSVGAV